MRISITRFGPALIAATAIALAGCGGGGGGGDAAAVTPPPPPPVTQTVSQSIAAAAAQSANDTSTNSSASFSVLQSAGVPAVTIASAPKVNFTVFSGGAVKQGLVLSNVSFAIAKLVPGTNGNPDEWVNYIYRTETATAGVGPGGTPALASAKQATSDPKQTDTALAASQLVYNPDGYYTYTFRVDITNPAFSTTTSTFSPYTTNGVVFEPGRTHRVAIQLSYANAAGETIRVNPYFDFTVDSSGKSVAATSAQTRKMVDVATCNGCHDKLALHGGGRVDTQYCVMCHNPGTTDANSGNVLTLSTMAHKIHAGKLLAEEGENYTIWGNSNSKHEYGEVGFPQPVRNCAKCHTGSNPATPQGDNWKSVPSKAACLSCHQSGSTSAWTATHITTLKLGTTVAGVSNSTCASCHGPTSQFSAERVHWVQEMANAVNYQSKIESVTLTTPATATATGKLTVKYAVVNPATGVAYDLREGCAAAGTTDSAGTSIVGCNSNYRWDAVLPPALPGKPTDKFGMFSLYLGVENLANITADDVTETSNVAAYRGVDDGTHHYTAVLTIPKGAKGNARVQLLGAVSERRIDPITRVAVGAVPPTQNSDLAYVPVKAPIMDVAIATGSTSTTPRRTVVSNDNCNNCHGILGLPTGSGKDPGFHKGLRNNADGCAMCHNANQAGSYTLMADGSRGPVAGDSQLAAGNSSNFLHESYQAKRFIHGIHGKDKRSFPFTHCMNVGGTYNKDGSNTVSGGPALGSATCVNQYPGVTTNFTPEVAYPGNLADCANCHVNDSWKQDKSVLGSVVFKQTGVTDMLSWQVISPKAASCTSCHDSKTAQTHVQAMGATFGQNTQADVLAGRVTELCTSCHAPGKGDLSVDKVHK
jgi:OmcA/MtrC family decaheme c-type cytochrome